jgi:Rieske Fe-S protein
MKKVSDAQPKQEITRREFCNGLLLTGLLIAATTPASEVAAQQEPLLAYPPMKIEGAERLMPGSSLYFTYPQRSDPAILVRADDGQFYAYGQKCSHMGCSVYYESASQRFECPCHKGAFDSKTGAVLFGPPTRPLAPIALQMGAGGEVWAVGRGVGSSDRTSQSPRAKLFCEAMT